MKRKTENSLGVSVLTGISVTILLLVLFALTGTWLVLKESISENSIHVVGYAALAVSTFVGVLVGALMAKKGIVVTAGLIAGGSYLLLLGCGILFFDGGFLPGFLLRAFIGAASAALACFAYLKKPSGKGSRKTRIR